MKQETFTKSERDTIEKALADNPELAKRLLGAAPKHVHHYDSKLNAETWGRTLVVVKGLPDPYRTGALPPAFDASGDEIRLSIPTSYLTDDELAIWTAAHEKRLAPVWDYAARMMKFEGLTPPQIEAAKPKWTAERTAFVVVPETARFDLHRLAAITGKALVDPKYGELIEIGGLLTTIVEKSADPVWIACLFVQEQTIGDAWTITPITKYDEPRTPLARVLLRMGKHVAQNVANVPWHACFEFAESKLLKRGEYAPREVPPMPRPPSLAQRFNELKEAIAGSPAGKEVDR